MAKSYNSRGVVAEMLVRGDSFALFGNRIAPSEIMTAEHVSELLKQAPIALDFLNVGERAGGPG